MTHESPEQARERLGIKQVYPKQLDDAAELFDAVYMFLGRFVAFPSEHARIAHTLWILHTHLMDAWESTPRIAFLSPEPGSGKTRALEITELLVPRPITAVNVSPTYLFRKVGDPEAEGLPTILFDEIDTVFGPKARDNEEIRGLLNAGHRRGAVAGRCVMRGKTFVTEEIPAFCPVALAGIGDLPDTILSRSIIIRMRRRAPDERVEAFRRRVHAPEGEALRGRVTVWAETVATALQDARPDMPDGVEDRDADVWEPLLAVADAAGDEWAQRARVAAVTLVALSRAATPSMGIKLLEDLRTVFADRDAMTTQAILTALHELPESAWADIRGNPLNDRGLAQRLRKYDIKPKVLRICETTQRGYSREDLHDAWKRYLGPAPDESVTSVTGETSSAKGPPMNI